MHLPKFGQIATLQERRLVGGPATQSMMPVKYRWLYETYKKAQTNFWRPQEVPLGNDKRDYLGLPPNVRHQYDLLFSMLTTMDLVVTEAIDVSIMRHAGAPELRNWLALQGFQEAIHTDSYVTIAEEIDLDPDEVFTRYLTNPALYAKIAMAGRYAEQLDGITDLNDPEQMERFIVAYTFFALILESLWFYVGLSAGTYPARFLGKMLGTADMFSFIRKDECVAEGTEVLTKKGWLPVEKLSMDTELLQWHEDNTTSWTYPIKLSTHQADSYYEFDLSSRGFKQKVSAAHRFPYYTISGRLKVVPACEATPNVYTQHPSSGKIRSEQRCDGSLTAEERFLVALQADGSVPGSRYTGVRNGTVPYTFNLTKRRKRDAFETILADLGWGYSTWSTNRGQTVYRVSGPTGLTKNFVDWVEPGKRSLAWCQDFVAEVAKWDGHIVPENNARITYSSTIKANTDMVQAIATLCGYRTKPTHIVDHRSDKFNDIHRLFINTHQDHVNGGRMVKTRVDEPVSMYGIEVPSSFLVIRCDDCVSVTGNSLHYSVGLTVINDIINENPQLDVGRVNQKILGLVSEGLRLEDAFAEETYRDLPGMSVDAYKEQCRFQMRFNLQRLGLSHPDCDGATLALPWISETVELQKETSFFERTNFNYQVKAGLFSGDEEMEDALGNDLWNNPVQPKLRTTKYQADGASFDDDEDEWQLNM